MTDALSPQTENLETATYVDAEDAVSEPVPIDGDADNAGVPSTTVEMNSPPSAVQTNVPDSTTVEVTEAPTGLRRSSRIRRKPKWMSMITGRWYNRSVIVNNTIAHSPYCQG